MQLSTHFRPAMPFGNSKIYFRGSFQFILSQFKKYHPSGNVKFNHLSIFQSLEVRILMEIIILISLKLNFTPNISGCYGLKSRHVLDQEPLTKSL